MKGEEREEKPIRNRKRGEKLMVNRNLWVWGYVMDRIPGKVPFLPFQSYCSLETACSYFGAENAVFMNSTHSMESLNDQLFGYLKNCRQVVCGLEHGHYLEAAERVSDFSLSHPNVEGAVIDDFLDEVGDYYKGPSAGMPPEELKAIQQALKKHNPALKLYVVRYTRQSKEDLLPYLDYFDVLNLWIWHSTRDFWEASYLDEIAKFRKLYRKPIMQGLFIHHYGFCDNEQPPMDPELMNIQCERIGAELRQGHIDSWCLLQNGWLSLPSHRATVKVLKDYLDWHYGTTTFR